MSDTLLQQVGTGSPAGIGTAFSNAPRSFSAQGVIQELPIGGTNVVIKHQAIRGFMAAMTMEFSVRDRAELKGLRIGDSVTFTVKANEEESWIEGLRRGTVVSSPPLANVKSLRDLAQVGKLKPGDLLPDADLLDENGDRIRFSDFRGRALAFTFMFTRCPLPEFCPRMSRRFAEARDLLVAKSPAVTNWQFLSISFDSEFDSPDVLKGYAMNYRGANSDRWLFVTASTNVTAALGEEIDFRVAKEGGSFAHNLRTLVLDRTGRIYRQFDGNRWGADELAQAVREAAGLANFEKTTSVSATTSRSSRGN